MLCDMRVSNKVRIDSLHLPLLDCHSKQDYLQIVAIKISRPCELKILMLWKDIKSFICLSAMICLCHTLKELGFPPNELILKFKYNSPQLLFQLFNL